MKIFDKYLGQSKYCNTLQYTVEPPIQFPKGSNVDIKRNETEM